jgi:DNA invertase Pin-like site-specific DNA recombinase
LIIKALFPGSSDRYFASALFIALLGVFSEFERAMIKEKINSGLARAKAQGKTLGRPKVSLQVETRSGS